MPRSSMTTHAFSPTCHRYSSPMTSSAGRPKNASNHFCDASRSRTHMTLYRSTGTTPPSRARTHAPLSPVQPHNRSDDETPPDLSVTAALGHTMGVTLTTRMLTPETWDDFAALV